MNEKITEFSHISVFSNANLGFKGNVSAVMLLEGPLNNAQMQSIASDLNQPATTFLWPRENKNEFNVRWFAPDAEISLCGHGSMAAVAYLNLFQHQKDMLLHAKNHMVKGEADREGVCGIILDPIPVTGRADDLELLSEALGTHVLSHYETANKNIVLIENEAELAKMKPDFHLLRTGGAFGYAVTAKGDKADFVSRTLVPHVQQLEDHATGSSHAALVPFWAERLNKNTLTAHQLSPRGGKFICENRKGGQVKLSGEYRVLAKGIFNMGSQERA